MRLTHGKMIAAVVLIAAITALSCEAREESGGTAAVQMNTPAGSLEGTWREVQNTIARGDSTVTQEAEPTLYIFTPTHYAMMGTLGASRALYSTLDPTDDEKLAAFNSFWGNTGTYEVTGDVLTIRPVFARNPNFMAGGYHSFRFSVAGDTLWLSSKSTDTYFRIDGEVVPDPRPLSETETKLVRVR